MFKIVVVGGPAEKYIDRCLQSILSQTEAFEAQVVLDPVGDDTYLLAKKYECGNLKVILNDQQDYAMQNIVKGIELLKCSYDDIIVTVDADDWFASNEALSIVRRYYDQDPELLVTYGSWVGYPDPNCATNCAPYLRHEFDSGLRNFSWRGTHLRTLKYKVWQNIQNKDLRDNDGKYLKTAWDMAFMIPALEMAGYDRSKYIPEKIYTYNKETPFNDEKMRYKQQLFDAAYINSKKKYDLMVF